MAEFCNFEMVIELLVVQFWSEIMLRIMLIWFLNHMYDFNQIALHPVQLPLESSSYLGSSSS